MCGGVGGEMGGDTIQHSFIQVLHEHNVLILSHPLSGSGGQSAVFGKQNIDNSSTNEHSY